MSECWIKPFDTPDEKRVITKGLFELIKVNGMTLGRATYEQAGCGLNTSALNSANQAVMLPMSA